MTVEIIISFFIATVISFIGSLQLGPVNMSVIQTAMNKSFKASVFVAVGGCIPEIIYCSVAFSGAGIIIRNPQWLNYFQAASVIIFFCLAVFSFRKTAGTSENIKSSSLSFLSGFTLGMLNPLLITFWITIIALLDQYNIPVTKNSLTRIAFAAGTAVGAFLLLLMFAAIVSNNRFTFIQRQQQHINKILGAIFLILAVIQFLKLIS